MATRVTQQEKELWISDIRDGHTISDIVTRSGRSRDTVRKYIMGKAAFVSQDMQEPIKEMEEYLQDGVDYGNNSHEDVGIFERSAYEFIEDGGFNDGESLWDSEARRLTALRVTQHVNKMLSHRHPEVRTMVKHQTLEHTMKSFSDRPAIQTMIKNESRVMEWGQWIGPIATDWALTDGGEKEDIAIIYGLAASYVTLDMLCSHNNRKIISNILEGFLKDVDCIKDEALEAKALLAIYRYIGITIAKYLKKHTRISQLISQSHDDADKIFLLSYACAHCNNTIDSLTYAQLFNHYSIINTITETKRGDTKYHEYLNFSIKGLETACKDIDSGAQRFSKNITRPYNIKQHLAFLMSHNYILNNNSVTLTNNHSTISTSNTQRTIISNRPIIPVINTKQTINNIGHKRHVNALTSIWEKLRKRNG